MRATDTGCDSCHGAAKGNPAAVTTTEPTAAAALDAIKLGASAETAGPAMLAADSEDAGCEISPITPSGAHKQTIGVAVASPRSSRSTANVRSMTLLSAYRASAYNANHFRIRSPAALGEPSRAWLMLLRRSATQ
jgi:hypothetical protein